MKWTTYSRSMPHTLLHGGSTPPTSTRLKNTIEDCGVFESGGLVPGVDMDMQGNKK